MPGHAAVGQASATLMVSEIGRPGDWVRALQAPYMNKFTAPTVEGVDFPALGCYQAWNDPALTTKWQAYTAVHSKIRQLDDGGQWDTAVTQATGLGCSIGIGRSERCFTSMAGVLDAWNGSSPASIW